MFLARCEHNGQPVVGVGVEPADVDRLKAGRPISFALRDALVDGPEADERVLVAYAKPHEMEQMRHGYFPGITDARVVLFLDEHTLAKALSGEPLNIQTPGAPVARFVMFCAERAHINAVMAFRAVGINVPLPAPPAPLTAERLEQSTVPTG